MVTACNCENPNLGILVIPVQFVLDEYNTIQLLKAFTETTITHNVIVSSQDQNIIMLPVDFKILSLYL